MDDPLERMRRWRVAWTLDLLSGDLLLSHWLLLSRSEALPWKGGYYASWLAT
jgi:hypothetical protein